MITLCGPIGDSITVDLNREGKCIAVEERGEVKKMMTPIVKAKGLRRFETKKNSVSDTFCSYMIRHDANCGFYHHE